MHCGRDKRSWSCTVRSRHPSAKWIVERLLLHRRHNKVAIDKYWSVESLSLAYGINFYEDKSSISSRGNLCHRRSRKMEEKKGQQRLFWLKCHKLDVIISIRRHRWNQNAYSQLRAPVTSFCHADGCGRKKEKWKVVAVAAYLARESNVNGHVIESSRCSDLIRRGGKDIYKWHL